MLNIRRIVARKLNGFLIWKAKTSPQEQRNWKEIVEVLFGKYNTTSIIEKKLNNKNIIDLLSLFVLINELIDDHRMYIGTSQSV